MRRGGGETFYVNATFFSKYFEKEALNTGVYILPHASINIVETNKHFGKRWKGIRKVQH